jgi:hypothetical protein
LNLDGRAFFLKRQRNHLTRSLRAPLGEPTFSREFRNIQRCLARNVPAVRAAFYAERELPGHGRCAILLTHALEGWHNLDAALEDVRTDSDARHRLLSACGALARRLHYAGLIHCCFYPRHVFVRKAAFDYETCLIDLEKMRSLLFGARDRVKDLEQFLRHAPLLDAQDMRVWLSRYLDCAPEDRKVAAWVERLRARRRVKENREAR